MTLRRFEPGRARRCAPPLSITYPKHGPLFVPDVNPEPKPLFCCQQSLGVTPSQTPPPLKAGPAAAHREGDWVWDVQLLVQV